MGALRTHNEFQVRKALRVACDKAGGPQLFAIEKNLDPMLVMNVLAGRSSPGLQILRVVGFSKITRYIKTGKRKGEAA